jgi:hypothetical protein
MQIEHQFVHRARVWIACVGALLLAVGCGRSSDGDSSAKDKDKGAATKPGEATPTQPDPAEATAPTPAAKAPAFAVPAGYEGVAITESEVLFKGESVGTPAAVVGDRGLLVAPIKKLLAAAGSPSGPISLPVLVAPTAPGDAVMATVRAAFEVGITDVYLMDRVVQETKDLVCEITAGEPAAPDSVKMSVLVEPARIWVGLSRVNDFRLIDSLDAAAFAEVIEEHGSSSYFADRKDAEIAVAAGIPAQALLSVLAPLCKRFPALRPLSRDELSAKPTLPEK